MFDQHLLKAITGHAPFQGQRAVAAKGILNGQAGPWPFEVEPQKHVGFSPGCCSDHVLCHTVDNLGQKAFAIVHQLPIIGIQAVPFQHRELFEMVTATFTLAETGTDLKDFVTAGSQNTLHAELGRGLQILALGSEGNNVALGDDDGLPQRGIDLEEAAGGEKTSD